MTAPPVVRVKWHDSLVGLSGWHAVGQSKEHAADAWAEPIMSVGFLVEDGDQYIVLANGWNPNSEGEPEVTGTMMIPRSEVMEMRTMRVGS